MIQSFQTRFIHACDLFVSRIEMPEGRLSQHCVHSCCLGMLQNSGRIRHGLLVFAVCIRKHKVAVKQIISSPNGNLNLGSGHVSLSPCDSFCLSTSLLFSHSRTSRSCVSSCSPVLSAKKKVDLSMPSNLPSLAEHMQSKKGQCVHFLIFLHAWLLNARLTADGHVALSTSKPLHRPPNVCDLPACSDAVGGAST